MKRKISEYTTMLTLLTVCFFGACAPMTEAEREEREYTRIEWREQFIAHRDECNAIGGRLDLKIKTGKATEIVCAAEELRARYATGQLAALYLQHVYAMLGHSGKAMEILEEINWLTDGLITALGIGDDELIQHWLMKVVEGEKQISSWRGIHATMAKMLDDRDAALAWLRDAYETESAPDSFIAAWAGYHDGADIAIDALRRHPDLWYLWLPVMESVRRDPSFVDLVHDIGLVDYWEEYGWGDFCARTANGDIVCK